MRALFIASILGALMLLVYASKTNKLKGSKAQRGKTAKKVQRIKTRQTRHSIERPKVPDQDLNLGDENAKSRREPQKIEIIEANGYETQPKVPSRKGDEPPSKDDELPIYERSRESIERLDYEARKKLTKDLTAEQWNTFLDKWYNTETGELDPKPLFYLVPLEDEKKVELMKEADEKNLELLFAALVRREYAPRSREAVGLLEKRLKDFPEMQSEALLTLYTWDFPLSKWHFTPTEKDLEVLFRVIKEEFFTRKQAIKHLPEIVEVDSVSKKASKSPLNLLMKKNLVEQSDFFNLIPCRKACKIGSLRYLEKAKEFCPTLLPDQNCVDEAVKEGHEHILEYIEKELGLKIVPRQRAVNDAAANGKLDMLQKRCHTWVLFPTEHGANWAANNGHLHILEWMSKLTPPIYLN